MDEAIITELTMRFDWEYFSQFPELASEVKERQRVIDAESQRSGDNKSKLKKILANLEERHDENGNWTATLKGYSYDKERASLDKLIEDIYEKNKSEFSSSEDVFTMFAKSSMTGRLLPVARLVEKTYGKGSFRMLGENL